MIVALTRGVGAKIGSEMRKEYFRLARLVTSQQSFAEMSDARKLFALDLVALSIFNARVVLPLHGSQSFMQLTSRAGVQYVRLAESTLDREFRIRARAATGGFFAILKSYGIEANELSIASPSEFISLVSRRSEFGHGQ